MWDLGVKLRVNQNFEHGNEMVLEIRVKQIDNFCHEGMGFLMRIIRTRWLKWRVAFGLLCDWCIPTRL